MQDLWLYRNGLRGSVPDELGSIAESGLSVMSLELNELSGKIPEAVASLMSCSVFGISFNRLSGRIPDGIGSMTRIGLLDISSNQFSGKLPASMAAMTNLFAFLINTNRLSGTIPAAVARLSPLMFFLAYDNRLSGSVPYRILFSEFLIINDNHLTGSLASLKALALILVGTRERRSGQATACFCENVFPKHTSARS